LASYVICAECGARIRSDREHCLRCGEPLRGVEPPAPPLAVHEALGLSETVFRALIVVVAIAVSGGVVWFWVTRPEPVDDVARPLQQVGAAPVPRKVSPPASEAAPATPTAIDPFTAGSSAPAQTAPDTRRDGSGAFAAGDYASARNFYQSAVDKNPNDAEAHSNLAQALERLGQIDDAVKHLERAVSLVPDKWAYRANLAHALSSAEKWDRAVTEYREAVRLSPADHATQYNLALALYKKGDAAAAVPEFEKAIALAPNQASFHFSLGMTYEKLGRVAEAVREYRKFLEMDPQSPDAPKLRSHVEALTAGQMQGRGSSVAPRP
jgi:Flp pilus assembly protein TadD